MLDAVDLVTRCAAYLPYTLGNAVHAVDVGLSEQTAVFSLPEGSETLVVDVDAGLKEMATVALRQR